MAVIDNVLNVLSVFIYVHINEIVFFTKTTD